MRKKYNLLDKGEILFKFGVFSLISAPLIGIISIFLSSLLSIITNKNSLFKDKLNVPIFVSQA